MSQISILTQIESQIKVDLLSHSFFSLIFLQSAEKKLQVIILFIGLGPWNCEQEQLSAHQEWKGRKCNLLLRTAGLETYLICIQFIFEVTDWHSF